MTEKFPQFPIQKNEKQSGHNTPEILSKIPKLREKIAREGIDWIIKTTRAELTDEEISDMIHGQGKQIFHFTKNYFDQIELPESEQELLKTPEELIRLRKQYTQFIRDNFTLSTTGLTTEQKKDLGQKMKSYKNDLNINNQDYQEWINGQKAAAYHDHLLYSAPPTGMPDTKNKAYSSIQFQDSFIHWRSPEYSLRRLGGQMPKNQFRIYLNPDSRNIVEVFQKIINKAEADKMIMTCKMQDRAWELANEYKRPEKSGEIRGDGIVLYLKDEADLKKMLDYSLAMFQETPDIFAGRKTNKIPCPIVPGISIGSEPQVPGESLTSYRIKFLDEVKEEVRQRAKKGNIDEVYAFKKILRERARKYNVNPDNIAFNASDIK